MKITKSMIKENTVFHCDTKEKANELLKKLDELGYTWADDTSYLDNTCYGLFEDNTCYDSHKGLYQNFYYYKKYGYTIIEYELDETDYQVQLEKANKRIAELEAAIKHLQGSNGNKQNRIKNLESKLSVREKAFEYACDIIDLFVEGLV